MYKCTNCGADLEFDPKTQKLKCSYCGGEFSPKELEDKKSIKAKVDKKDEYEIAEEKKQKVKKEEEDSFDVFKYKCPQCGAELMTTEETGATFCSYCGSSVLLESKVGKQKKPSYIIPFKMTKEECENAYRSTLSKFWFAPRNMAKEEQIEKFRGIYMPYWVYSLEREGTLDAIGSRSYRRGDYIYNEKYSIYGNVNAKYDGISFDASSNFYDDLSERISPYNVEEGEEFAPAYLSGFYADVGDVDSEIYEDNAQDVAEVDIINRLRKDSSYVKLNAEFDRGNMINVKSSQMGFFPVWFLASKNKKGDRVSYAVINGQTGKVAVEIPIDLKKYIMASILLALPIFILLNMFLTLTPINVTIFSIVASIICLIVTNSQLNKVYAREMRLEDEGYMYKNEGKRIELNPNNKEIKSESSFDLSIIIVMIVCSIICLLVAGFFGIIQIVVVIILMIVNGKKNKIKAKPKKKIKMSFEKKIKTLISPIIAIMLSIGIVIMQPVLDIYYYVMAVVSAVFIFKSFWDIIKLYNLLNTRKLPQLDKRGGDENE